jgi:hypothetical protein
VTIDNGVFDPATSGLKGFETATFCFRCGATFTDPLNLTDQRHPFCWRCQIMWERLYVTSCPASDGAWVHLYSPASVEANDEIVTKAVGHAWCEFCSTTLHLYTWTPNEIAIVDVRGRTVSLPLDDVWPAS